MGKKTRIALCCAGGVLVVCVVTVMVVLLLHKRNVITPEPIPETSSYVEESTARSDLPETMSSTEVDDVRVIISEDAGGFRQDVLLAATVDYCKQNGITGDVTISDAEYLDDGSFNVEIETKEGSLFFGFSMENYVR